MANIFIQVLAKILGKTVGRLLALLLFSTPIARVFTFLGLTIGGFASSIFLIGSNGFVVGIMIGLLGLTGLIANSIVENRHRIKHRR